MFNNLSNIDPSRVTVHHDQYYTSTSVIQGNETVETIVYGNQIIQDSRSNLAAKILQKASALSAAYDSAQRYPAPKCLEGTRAELLDRVASWMDDSDHKSICWLNGPPGSGKSAVSQTIAEKYAGQKRLAASFFFSRRDIERHTAQHVIPTLTTQLVAFLPSIRPAVIAALEAEYMLPTKVLREQMEKLLLRPLTTATETPDAPILIIVDALDECDDKSLVSELVMLLALLVRTVSLPLRLLITSRTEPWLQTQFHHTDVSPLTLPLDLHAFSAEADIRAFLRHALDDTYHHHFHVMEHLPPPWPTPDDLERIVSKASGLFIFATTVVKFVDDGPHNPAERLQAILEDKPPTSAGPGSAYDDLDALYRDAISVFPDPDLAHLVLGVVYCLTIPLTVSGLQQLLQRPDVNLRRVVPALSSVLLASEDGRQPIQFFHGSFRDFLINPQRSKKHAINPDVYHQLIAEHCLEMMTTSLKRDMCGIGDPSLANNEISDLAERQRAAFDEGLRYACRFWSHHLASLPRDGVTNEALLGALKRFSTTALLHWVEALSILGEVENAVVKLREGISWLKTLRAAPGDVVTLLQDAERLVVLSMEPISQCALQVYQTALSFAPVQSAIYTTYKDQSYGTFVIYPRRSDGWPVLRRGNKLHTPIHCVVFSPNGDLIATAAEKQGVQLWDSVTGSNIASLGDPSSSSLLVRFSPSGAFLAAAFEGGTVAIWDPKVGREHMKDDRCHTKPIRCLEFSQNSNLLASGSRDNTILVWSMNTAQRLYRLAAHAGPVTSLVFAHDSLRLYSGSEDNLVVIWDMSSGKLIRSLTGHRKPVNCVAISKDDNTLASGSEDKSIKIWDVTSGKCTCTFSKEYHSGIQSLHFLDEDKLVVAASDHTIVSWTVASRNTHTLLWSAEEFLKRSMMQAPTWQAKAIGRGVPKRVFRLIAEKAFSGTNPERAAIAYATHSPSFVFGYQEFIFTGTLPNPVVQPPFNASGIATSVAMSPDGNWVATADSVGSLQFLDLAVSRGVGEESDTATNPTPLGRTANHMTPSPSGKRFVIKTNLKWYLVDDEYHAIKKIDLGLMDAMKDGDDIRVKFSSNSSVFVCVVASLFNDDKDSVRVFDAETGEQRAQFTSLKKVQTFLPSPSGGSVACGHVGSEVEILWVENGAKTSITVAGDSSVTALAFSGVGDELVSGSKAGMVQIWDRSSGQCNALWEGNALLEGNTSGVTALAYASTVNGTKIAIGREDGSICVWSPGTRDTLDIVGADQPTTKNVDLLKFSDDQSTITSRGEDLTVSKWVIPTGTEATLNARPDVRSLANLVSQTDPHDICDGLFHTSYMVRKDGWIVDGNRRVLWLPPLVRPRGNDSFCAYDDGLLVSLTASDALFFMRWVKNADS